MIGFNLRWMLNRGLGSPAAAVLLATLPMHQPALSQDGQAMRCPDPVLARYASQAYATEEGVRHRCGLLREIDGGGEPVPDTLRHEVIRELSNRFAVDIDFTGTVELPPQTVEYLLKNMPETAVLVSTYSGNEYKATQSDATPGPRKFFVTNNDTFAAGFTYLLSRSSPNVSEHMFFESGYAKVLFWKIWGKAFVRYKLLKDGEDAASYDIRIHVFTESRLLRTILSSGLFRYFSRGMFRDILEDIETSVHRFAGDPDPHENLPPYFVTGLKDSLHGGIPGTGPHESPTQTGSRHRAAPSG